MDQSKQGVWTLDKVISTMLILQQSVACLAEHVKTGGNQARPPKNQASVSSDMETDQMDIPGNFEKLVKNLFRFVQVSHHSGNWTQTPKGIAAAINKLIASIKPPMPNEEVMNELAALGLEFADKIGNCVSKHLSVCKSIIEQDLLKTESQETDKARETATRHLISKFDRKLSSSNRDRWMSEAVGMVHVGTEESTVGAIRPAEIHPTGPTADGSPSKDQSSRQQTEDKARNKAITAHSAGSSQIARSYAAAVRTEPLALDSPNKRRRVSQQETELDSDQEVTITIPDSLPQRAGHTVKTGRRSLNGTHRKNDPEPNVCVINSDCRVLIIGDSNIQNLTGLPKDVQIESYRGAKFTWLTDIVKGVQLPDSVSDIVLAAGINLRNSDWDKEVEPTLRTCIDAMKSTKRTLHFLEISSPPGLKEAERQTMYRINDYMWQQKDVDIIPKLASKSVKTIPDGIHYDQNTLGYIKDMILDHFYSKDPSTGELAFNLN